MDYASFRQASMITTLTKSVQSYANNDNDKSKFFSY